MGERGVARGALRGANRDDSVSVEVLRAGALTTVQDLGRAGYAHLGVPRAGAVDLPALLLANRLVGNPPTAAGLEITMTGCTLRFDAATVIAVTGAEVTRLRIGTRPADLGVPVPVRAGAVVEIGPYRPAQLPGDRRRHRGGAGAGQPRHRHPLWPRAARPAQRRRAAPRPAGRRAGPGLVQPPPRRRG